jgi:hypothetical protein
LSKQKIQIKSLFDENQAAEEDSPRGIEDLNDQDFEENELEEQFER